MHGRCRDRARGNGDTAFADPLVKLCVGLRCRNDPAVFEDLCHNRKIGDRLDRISSYEGKRYPFRYHLSRQFQMGCHIPRWRVHDRVHLLGTDICFDSQPLDLDAIGVVG